MHWSCCSQHSALALPSTPRQDVIDLLLATLRDCAYTTNTMRLRCSPQHDVIKLPLTTGAVELAHTTRCAYAAMRDKMRSSYRPQHDTLERAGLDNVMHWRCHPQHDAIELQLVTRCASNVNHNTMPTNVTT